MVEGEAVGVFVAREVWKERGRCQSIIKMKMVLNEKFRFCLIHTLACEKKGKDTTSLQLLEVVLEGVLEVV